jgi:hypothetical protein
LNDYKVSLLKLVQNRVAREDYASPITVFLFHGRISQGPKASVRMDVSEFPHDLAEVCIMSRDQSAALRCLSRTGWGVFVQE